MKKFHFKLETWLKIKKLKEQDQLNELAKVTSKMNKHRSEIDMFFQQSSALLKNESDAMKHHGNKIDIRHRQEIFKYLSFLNQRKRAAERHIEEMRPELGAKIENLNKARKERRVIEILKEKKYAEYKKESAKEEQTLSDEFNSKSTQIKWRQNGE